MPDASRPSPEPREPGCIGQRLELGGLLSGEEPDFTGGTVAEDLLEAISAVQDVLAPASPPETAADRARRLAADRKIVEVLRQDDFEGERFNRLASDMFTYGWPVMMKWLGTGEIFQRTLKCRGRIRRHHADQEWTHEDRRQLAIDTLLEGVEVFRRQLRTDRWDPAKGASLKTYFIGACVCAFTRVYELWRKEQIFTDLLIYYSHVDEIDSVRVAVQSRLANPEELAVVNDLVNRTLKSMNDPELIRIMGLSGIVPEGLCILLTMRPSPRSFPSEETQGSKRPVLFR